VQRDHHTHSESRSDPAADFLHLPEDVRPQALSPMKLQDIGAAIENSAVGILVADDDLRISALNRRARPLFAGVPDVLGKPWPEILRLHWTEDAAAAVTMIVTKTLATGVPYSSIGFSADRADLQRKQSFHWEVHRIAAANARRLLVCYFVGPLE
jgi:PAS domain-containing protein